MTALSVACPACGAMPLEHCRTARRGKARTDHAGRIAAGSRRFADLKREGIGDLDRARFRRMLREQGLPPEERRRYRP